jgi:hypothetical protein
MPAGKGGRALPDLSKLPVPVRAITEGAFGHGIADVFLYASPFAFIALLLVLFVREVPLKTASGLQQGDISRGHGGAGTPAHSPVAAALDNAVVALPEEESMDGISIHGSVCGADGSAVVSATVTLISLHGQQLGRAMSGQDGTYAIGSPGAGAYVLIAAAEGHQPQAVTVVVGHVPLTHDIILSGTSGLAGVVRTLVGALPVGDAMVVVTDVRGEVLATGKTGVGGAFRFDALPAGMFTVAVNAGGYRPVALPVEVGVAGTTRIEVELRSGAYLQGTVRAGADRRPLTDARVTLLDAAGNVAGTATTGDDGTYAFTDLDSGDYTLIASGYPPVATSLIVDSYDGEGHDVELGHPEQ